MTSLLCVADAISSVHRQTPPNYYLLDAGVMLTSLPSHLPVQQRENFITKIFILFLSVGNFLGPIIGGKLMMALPGR